MTPSHRPPLPSTTSTGEALAWVSGLVLALSSFMGWYSGNADIGGKVTLSVIGWHTGTLGKLVFFVGLAVVILLVLRATGPELPHSFPTGGAVAALGALGTIFVLVRLIDIPDRFVETGRGIGIWISLAAALVVIVAGLLQAREEL